MENQAAKIREGDDDGDVGSDRISRLPDPVLHHILCFLSQKKAVQTSVLSKSWRHIGPTRPVIEFHGDVSKIFIEGTKEAFLSRLEQTFQRYHDRNIFPRKLSLEMFKADLQSISVLEKWIRIFINPDNPAVTSFRLSFDGFPYFNPPLAVFKAESLRNLSLQWCSLDEIDSIDNLLLKNLRNLSLCSVVISNEALEKVISGCPLLERLVLDHSHGFKTIVIKGNKNRCLDYFDLSCCYSDTNEICIEIDSPTLESIRIEGTSNWHPNNNNYFPHLKSLILSRVKLTTESFGNFSCNFPRLQELSLLYCYGFDEINLSSRSIKRLIINESRSEFEKVSIEVPNILYFELSIGPWPITVSLATTSEEWKSRLILHNCLGCNQNDVLPSILELFGLVKALSQSQISLTLYGNLNFKIDQIDQWDFNDHPVVVQHLDLNIMNQLRFDSLGHVLNVLLCVFRPRYMAEKSWNTDEKVTNFLWNTMIHAREKTDYGWEQHLEEVSIEASDTKEEEVWHHVQHFTWSKDQKIRFRLKWRD